MLTRTLCATQPRRANLPGPALSPTPCRAAWPPPGPALPSSLPLPQCRGSHHSQQVRPALSCPALPDGWSCCQYLQICLYLLTPSLPAPCPRAGALRWVGCMFGGVLHGAPCSLWSPGHWQMLFACLWLPCLPFPWVLGTGELPSTCSRWCVHLVVGAGGGGCGGQ